jgi:hypothetical protein
MNKKLLDSFVEPETLIKDAAEKDCIKIKNFLKQRIRIVDGCRLDRKEIKCVRKILDSLEVMIKNPSTVTKNKWYMFISGCDLDVQTFRGFLREFAVETTEALANQKIMVECRTGYSDEDADNSLIVECAR